MTNNLILLILMRYYMIPLDIQVKNIVFVDPLRESFEYMICYIVYVLYTKGLDKFLKTYEYIET